MLGHWTCHTSIGFVNLKLGLWLSFILNDKSCLFLDLDVGRGAWSLRWTCQLEAGPSAQLFFNDKLYLFLDLDVGRWGLRSSIGLVTLRLGLRPSFILNDKLCLFLDLDVGRLDLSLHYSTCHLEAGPSAQLHS